MSERKALLKHGAIVECPTHKRKRVWKANVSAPKTKCPVCWAVWLSDRLETNIYEEEFYDLIRFSNTFTKVVKPKGIEFVETAKDD